MAIDNLSGNFQPLTSVSGRPLPQPEVRDATRSSGAEPVAAPVADVVDAFQNQIANEPNEEQISESTENIRTQIAELNQVSQNIQRRLSFQVDDELGQTVVRVIDRETDELIRQIPSDEVLALSKRLKELSGDVSEVSSGILIQREV